MNPILRNILAVLAGLVVGSIINGAIIALGHQLFPIQVEADLNTPEGLALALPHFRAEHYLMPFLAHALGTFVGAFLAAYIGVSLRKILALIVGVFFFAGGVMMIAMISPPLWFILLDLGVAYIPMALLAHYIVTKYFVKPLF
ncbi:MAG: hypothetical protein Q4F57_07705 [Weeksellaceae bacterium]|nr:hypothetical protein [Weeksellaceae bacterium]